MRPSQIRRELLDQHLALRTLMADAGRIAHRCEDGEAAKEELRHALVRLTDLFRMHNRREEELLRDVFPNLDAWGPVRAQVMVEEHVDEHSDLFQALMAAASTDDAHAAAAKAKALFDRIVVHMDREEKVFLNGEVLSDDATPPDSFGG